MSEKFRGMARPMTTDAAIAGGMTFLVKELEKRDAKILEPLTSVTWPRDMPVRTGGGFIESVAAVAINYGSAGNDENGLISGQTTNIPVMQADLKEQAWKTVIWSNILKVSYIDQQKLQNIGRSLDDLLAKGIQLNQNKALDKSVYLGFANHGFTGLINNASVTRYTAAKNSDNDTEWEDKTPDEILNDINDAILKTWEESEYDLSGMANHILIPPDQFAYIVATKVNTAADKSILTYLLENNIGKNQGIDLSINPCRWCEGAGTSGVDRMVAYANNEDRVRIDITVPLKRWVTQADATQMAYLTPYLSQWSEVQFLYEQPVVYVDGI